ncbi:MAG: hypothetical protein HW388_1501 [Dehalococcoidia bacterium]|nr:hypothetical protein [Dehalococcoidia bacterium]
MEAVFFVVVGMLTIAHSDYLLERLGAKALGLAGAVVAIVLLALVLFPPVPMYTEASKAALVTLMLAWATAGAVMAGAYLYGYDERMVGRYALGLAVVSLFLGTYFLVGDWTDPATISYPAGAVTLLLAVVAATTHLVIICRPPFAPPKQFVGLVTMASGAVVLVIGLLALVGVVGLAA